MTLGQDLRSSMRMMSRAPGFAAAAVATLALGLGLNSAALSYAYALFLKPLPVEEPMRVVVGSGVSFPDYAYYREHARSFSDLAAQYSTSPMHVTTRDSVSGEGGFGVMGAVVTANYFSALRLRPALGRFFTDEEARVPGRDAVAVISYDLWRTRFDGDARILGTNLTINGTSFTIVGIAPQGFNGTEAGLEPNTVWIPTGMLRMGYRYCNAFDERTCRVLTLLGRLAPEATIDDARSEITVLGRQLDTAFPIANQRRDISLRLARGVRIIEQSRDASIVALLAGASALVLLVASANVAGLLLARGLRRRKEIAIRMALGAGRWRLMRQLLVESSVLAAAGGAAGLMVALWATEMLHSFFGVGASGPLNVEYSILDGRILVAGLIVALGTGIVTGVVPALQATRRDTLPALKDETAGTTVRRSHLRDALIVLQLAASVLLLVGSGLLVRSFFMLHRGPGFDPETVVTTRLRPSLVDYTHERAWAYQREVIRRLEALPGVVAASPARVVHLPGWARPLSPILLPGETGDPSRAFRTPTSRVGPRYFKMLGVVPLEGREFDERDTASSSRVTVVNDTLARRLWPKGNAVGTMVTIEGTPHEVIGVVDDVQFVSVFGAREPIAYLDYWQDAARNSISYDAVMHIRVQGDGASMLPVIRRTIAAIDPNVPASAPRTLGGAVDSQFVNVRGARTLLVTFGALALVVSAIGLYATLAFSVGQRTREIAIRMALGAARDDVGRLVFRHGAAIVLVGIIVGLAAAVAAGPLLAHLLYGVSPYDPVALFVAPCLLGPVALLAIWLPARRAIAIEPIKALRAE